MSLKAGKISVSAVGVPYGLMEAGCSLAIQDNVLQRLM